MTSTTSVVVPKRPVIWDCGTTLYDSFELKSFERQLQSALTRSNSSSSSKLFNQEENRLGPKPSRTQSLPHFSLSTTLNGGRGGSGGFVPSLNDNESSSSSPFTSSESGSVKKKNKTSRFKQLLRSVFFIRSSKSTTSSDTSSGREENYSKSYNYNCKEEEEKEVDQKVICSSESGRRWFQLIYEDDNHLVYEKDKSCNKPGNIRAPSSLSTIPEVPEVLSSSPQQRRRRWSSSSILVGKSTMSDRFTTRLSSSSSSHEC